MSTSIWSFFCNLDTLWMAFATGQSHSCLRKLLVSYCVTRIKCKKRDLGPCLTLWNSQIAAPGRIASFKQAPSWICAVLLLRSNAKLQQVQERHSEPALSSAWTAIARSRRSIITSQGTASPSGSCVALESGSRLFKQYRASLCDYAG